MTGNRSMDRLNSTAKWPSGHEMSVACVVRRAPPWHVLSMNVTTAAQRGLHLARWRTTLWTLALLGVACNESTDTVKDPSRRVCPDCPAVAGGESSDFGGTPHPCVQFESKSPIDAAQARALGFDVSQLEQLVQREVDAPLRWRPDPSPSGARPPAGYEADTRIQLRASIAGYTHVKLDPSSCVETTCRPADTSDELSCSDRLELAVEAELHTGDGAVSASLAGYVLLGRPGFAFAEVPAGTLFASLRDVTGTLELFAPDDGFPIQRGLLLADVYFGAARTSGAVRASMMLRTGQHITLTGYWGELDRASQSSGHGGAGVLPRDQ